ncbi:MAG TPA: transglutaminase-like domain-containing protein [Abditibacteriaceae bacterium]|jgi:hypothetical protein
MNTQLPFLLKLVDDPSPAIRQKIAAKLRELGPNLRGQIDALQLTLSDSQREALRPILVEQADEAARLVTLEENAALLRLTGFTDGEMQLESDGGQWLGWLQLENEWDKLEAALTRLATWQTGPGDAAYGPESSAALAAKLDELADEFRRSGRAYEAAELSEFLFVEKGLHGAPSFDYYNPLNSNLAYVVEEGRGIPISLATLFMLVGHRLGLEIYGCNFPGHFLARSREWGHDLFFDCFDRGRLLTELEAAAIRKAAPDTMQGGATAEEMVARFLRNLAVAYEQNGDASRARFMLARLEELEQAMQR